MKNKKLIGSVIVIAFVLMLLSTITNSRSLNPDNSPKASQGAITPDELIPINFTIYINGNWSETVALYDWATGSGTEEDPYIIEGIHVTNENQTAHISIETAEYFIIRNVTVSNYAKPYGHYTFAGIYIEKAEFGLIDNVTIINTSHGISLAEAKDSLKITNSRFIGSHNDSRTGMGNAILIHEAKGVEIYNNTIFNYYSGIVVYDAEEISIENNTIETSFGYISDTGIYFYGVNDSAIINNDLYGCNFGGHFYDDPFTSSIIDGLKTSDLINSYNITIYGNRFYDLQGNLIGDFNDTPDEPDVPDVPDDVDNVNIIIPNYWTFIILIGVFGSFVGIYIFFKIKKKE